MVRAILILPACSVLRLFFSSKIQVWFHIVLHLSYVWQTPGAKSPSKQHIAGTRRFRASYWWQMSLLKWARRWKWQGCDGRHEDSFSAATCHHQCCWGVMGRDWRGLEAPTAVWGVCLCAQQGPSLKCPTHLACKQPAPNLAARQPASQQASKPPSLCHPIGMEVSPSVTLAALPVDSSGYRENS